MLRVVHNVDQEFCNLVQGLFKKYNHSGYRYFEEDENGDVIMGGNGMAVDSDGKYVINYDNPIARLGSRDLNTALDAMNTLEDVDNGGIAKILSDPENCPQIKLRSEINFPEA